jgi:hypothetical protein
LVRHFLARIDLYFIHLGSPKVWGKTADYSDVGFGFVKRTNECVFEPNIKRPNREVFRDSCQVGKASSGGISSLKTGVSALTTNGIQGKRTHSWVVEK